MHTFSQSLYHSPFSSVLVSPHFSLFLSLPVIMTSFLLILSSFVIVISVSLSELQRLSIESVPRHLKFLTGCVFAHPAHRIRKGSFLRSSDSTSLILLHFFFSPSPIIMHNSLVRFSSSLLTFSIFLILDLCLRMRGVLYSAGHLQSCKDAPHGGGCSKRIYRATAVTVLNTCPQ